MPHVTLINPTTPITATLPITVRCKSAKVILLKYIGGTFAKSLSKPSGYIGLSGLGKKRVRMSEETFRYARNFSSKAAFH